MAQFRFPKFPGFAPGPQKDVTVPIEADVRTELTKIGPYGPPRIGEKAPHKDIGDLAYDFIGDLQGVGENIMKVLDMPFDATIKIKGPHRLIDAGLDIASGVPRNLIQIYTRIGKEEV